ncbi:MAG TPA: non-canonical purine NTP pyrophosphatase [Candidatus Paceibacterota bacterium]|nr:non-canonical purine NTP pyrophosphatase [Candidatus Paceibacterota bacterium]
MKIILASHNPGKTKEFRELFAGTDAEILNLDDAGIKDDPVENGNTFLENAAKKAEFAANRLKEKCWVMADDSGICVAMLKGAPGVRSARWAGENASGEAIVAHTLAKLAGAPPERRGAWFECAIVLISPDGKSNSFSGHVMGKVTEEPHGTAYPKLPYDTIFVPNGYQKTFAELPDETKNALSHRGRAAELAKQFLYMQGLLNKPRPD